MRGRAIFLLYQLGPEGRQRAGYARVVHRSGAAHRGLPRHAARGSRRAAGGRRGSPATRDAGVRREVAVSMRDQPADNVAGHPGRRRARLRRAGSQLPGSAGNRRDRKGAGALRPAAHASSASRTIRWRGRGTFTWIAWRLHVPAAVADLTARARVVDSCRSPIAGSRWIRSRSSTIRPRRRRCSASRSRTARCASRRRCGC